MRTLIEHNGKWIECGSATEALIAENAIYNDFPENELRDLMAIAYDCYLHSEDPIDVGEFTEWLCTYWATEKGNNKWDILTDYQWGTEE